MELLHGLGGSNPLHFMASLGILAVLDDRARTLLARRPRLAWTQGGWHPSVDTELSPSALIEALDDDRRAWSGSRLLSFAFPKIEKNGVKASRTLRVPCAAWRAFLEGGLERPAGARLDVASALAAETAVEHLAPDRVPEESAFEALGCPLASNAPLDRVTQQTAFDFTSRNEQLLDQVERIRAATSAELMRSAVSGERVPVPAAPTLGWDPACDAPRALFYRRQRPNPALEWLAFRGLTFFPVFSRGERLAATGCQGRRRSGSFTWPLWSPPIPLPVVRSLLARRRLAASSPGERRSLGILHVLRAGLARGADGYSGIFTPAAPV